MHDLKPCAFCGVIDAKVVQTTENQDFGEEVFMVVCPCGESTDYFYFREEAVAAWNKPA